MSCYVVLLIFILQPSPHTMVIGKVFHVCLVHIAIANILVPSGIIIGSQFRDGDLRLVGGSYQWEGRVEIFYSGSWGSITDPNWTSEDAAVACRMMGYFRPGIKLFGAHSLSATVP